MIITLTLNTALDHILHIPEFKFGTTVRSTRSYLAMGGKGTDAAYILGTLGIKNIAMGFSAGIFGAKMESMLRDRGVETDFVHVDGETRLNTLLIRGPNQQSTFTVDTLEIGESDIDQLMAKLTARLDQAGCVVLGGTPPSTFPLVPLRELLDLTKQHDIPLVIDASGEALRIACETRPAFIKINQDEMGQLLEKSISSRKETLEGASEINKSTGASVIVTLGDQGAFAVMQDQTMQIHPLDVPIVNTAGAGDAVLAGLAHAVDSGSDIVEGLRLGFAAAAAVMMTPQTAECDPVEVNNLLEGIEISSL
jgi:1-phosphofructokinase